MKVSFFASLTAAALLTATSTFAAPPADSRDQDGPRYEQGPGRRADSYTSGNDRATPQVLGRWQGADRNDRRDDNRYDRSQNYGFDRDYQVSRDEHYRWESGHNYGYAASHRVSPRERDRWEATYRR